MTKAFLIDLEKCTGCFNCQIGCKDEHCGQSWLPYAEAEPEIGQFWMNVKQYERGAVPHVRVAYIPVMGGQNEEIRAFAPEVLMDRDDGLIVIDPAKAKGRKDIADKFDGVYWNEELQIPQACTGCAHLVDGNEPIKTPRCVDNCITEAILFDDVENLDLEGAELLDGWGETGHVYYKNLPKKFIAATVYDPATKEIIEGAVVTATGDAGTFSTTTDDWGDFWLKGLPDADWKLTIENGGKKVELEVSTKDKDMGLGNIALA